MNKNREFIGFKNFIMSIIYFILVDKIMIIILCMFRALSAGSMWPQGPAE